VTTMTTGRYENLDGLRLYDVKLNTGEVLRVWSADRGQAKRGVRLSPGERVVSVQIAVAG